MDVPIATTINIAQGYEHKCFDPPACANMYVTAQFIEEPDTPEAVDFVKRFQIYIKDNGVGFQTDYDSKLFQTFNKLHDEFEYEGKGVGIATVKKIMNRHFGNVKIRGEKDQGCVNILVFRKELKTTGL